MCICNKYDNMNTKEMDTIQKEHPICVSMAKMEESTGAPSMVLALLSTSKKSHVYTNHIKHSEIQESFLE